MREREGLLPIVFAGGVVIVCLAFFLVPWEHVFGGEKAVKLWLGTRGLADLTLGTLTFTAGVVTVFLLFKRARNDDEQIELAKGALDHARRAELGSRFQKGVEMLSSDSVSVRIGGIFILRDVAIDTPALYHLPVIEMLLTFVREETRSQQAALFGDYVYNDTSLLSDDEAEKLGALAIRQTPSDVKAAFETVGIIRKRPQNMEAEEDALQGRKLSISEICLSACDFAEGNFSNMYISDSVFRDVRFQECEFRETTFNVLLPTTKVRFVGCTLTGINLQELDRREGRNRSSEILVLWSNLVDGAICIAQSKLDLNWTEVSRSTTLEADSIRFTRVWTRNGLPTVVFHNPNERSTLKVFEARREGTIKSGVFGVETYSPAKDELPAIIEVDHEGVDPG